MRFNTVGKYRKMLGAICGGAIMLQLGSCDIGNITTTTTLNGRDAIIQIIRGAILTPIDAFITSAVNEAFGDDT